MGVRMPPGSGIVPPPATFDGGTVKFQYYNDGGPVDGGGSPSTFAVPGSVKFYNHFTVTVSGNQIIFEYLQKTHWLLSQNSLLGTAPINALFIQSGALISSVAGIPSFTNVTIDPSSILPPIESNAPPPNFFNANNVTWTSEAVAVTWAGCNLRRG